MPFMSSTKWHDIDGDTHLLFINTEIEPSIRESDKQKGSSDKDTKKTTKRTNCK